MNNDEMSEKITALLEGQKKIMQSIEEMKKSIYLRITESDRINSIRELSKLAVIDTPWNLNDRHIYNMKYVDAVYEFEMARNIPEISRVMMTQDRSFTAGERSGPSDPAVLSNGHFKTMLKRYIFSGKTFCADKKVLDSCCGRGWGANIISHYAQSVTAFDLDQKLIGECKSFWGDDRIDWRVGSALEQSFLPDRTFDVALSMEAIEHFTQPDGEIYLRQIEKKLKDSAIFVGTSFFPNNRHQADNHASVKREDHHYLWTKTELTNELKQYFDRVDFIDGWMFVARRGNNN